MKTKASVALLLAALILGSLMPVSAVVAPTRPGILISPRPAAAVSGSSFTDIYDRDTAEQAEILRLLGVVEGTGGSRFEPEGTLTRAQFTKMVIALLGESNEVQRFAGYTIFPDVRGSYWAAGYVNYALRGCSVKFISGYPDGRFGPEDPITLGQAVTILMRLLGYTDAEVGLTWPDGYLATAASIGLTEGLEGLDGFDAITRAQAAQLFTTLLTTPNKAGTPYAATLLTCKEDVVVLDTAAQAGDGTPGALATTEGTRKVLHGPVSTLFTGRRGDLLLDKNGLVCGFLPETGGTARTLSVASARSGYLTDGDGTRYPVPADTALYLRGEATSYGAGYGDLTPGTVVTVYYNAAGQADYLFAGAAARTAALVQADGSAREIDALADGASYTIYKNGAVVTAAQLRQYDVVTYDAASRTATVCDTRISGAIQTAAPDYDNPATVTVLGNSFDLLPAAAADLSGFRQGDAVVLLLTAEGRVAGIRAAGTVKSNIWGIVRACSPDSATVELMNGMTVSGDPDLSGTAAAGLAGLPVYVSSEKLGKLTLTELSSRVRGSLDVDAGTLNGVALAPQVRIYQRVTGIGTASALGQLTLDQLPAGTIDNSRILYAGYDYLGRAEVLVLEDITGDLYEYGKMTYTAGSLSGPMGSFTSGTITIENGSSHTGSYNLHTQSGVYGGMVLSAQGGTVVDVVYLKQLTGVSRAAFAGDTVTVGGTVYPVSDRIKCWNETLKAWVSLTDAMAYSDKYDLWYDRAPAQGGAIRVLVVK